MIDFLLLRAKLLEITTWLDHYVLLPTDHPQIRVEDNGSRSNGDLRRSPLDISHAAIAASFPSPIRLRNFWPPTSASDCCAALADAAKHISHIRVELDECDGQIGVWQSDPERSIVI